MTNTFDTHLIIGDTFELNVYWEDSEGNRIPLLGKTIRFAIRFTNETLYDKTSASDEINRPEITDPTRKGEILISIPPSETAEFTSGALEYDLEVTEDAIGWKKTILRGRINTLTETAR
jgi:hypothetical protein